MTPMLHRDLNPSALLAVGVQLDDLVLAVTAPECQLLVAAGISCFAAGELERWALCALGSGPWRSA